MEEIAIASRGKRFVASGVDFVLLPLVGIAVVAVTGAVEQVEDYLGYQPVINATLVAFGTYFLTNGWLLYARGQTVGKALTGIGIVGAQDARRPPFGRLVLRALFFPLLYLLFLPPFTLLPLVDVALIARRDRRCLHDLICGTRVADLRAT